MRLPKVRNLWPGDETILSKLFWIFRKHLCTYHSFQKEHPLWQHRQGRSIPKCPFFFFFFFLKSVLKKILFLYVITIFRRCKVLKETYSSSSGSSVSMLLFLIVLVLDKSKKKKLYLYAPSERIRHESKRNAQLKPQPHSIWKKGDLLSVA